MKRTIKFRGQKINSDEWVYGYYFYSPITFDHNIITEPDTIVEIKPETVCQFVGIDNNGVEVYEGDYIKFKKKNGKWLYCTVIWDNVGFTFEKKTKDGTYKQSMFTYKEKIYALIVGNIFDGSTLPLNKE